MARKRKNMRQITEVLRLKHEHQLSVREIGRSCGLPPSTVGDYLKRAQAAGLTWPLPETLTEPQLQDLLMKSGTAAPPAESTQPLPDWPQLHQELARKGVTLQLLWREYRQTYPEGYGYSRFCQLYGRWADTLEPTMRHFHAPGEKMFVDWAGPTIPIHLADGTLGEAYLFVAVLGASNKTYLEAFLDMKLASWLTAHCHAYAFYGGVARVVVPDNTKTAVVSPCRYEPLLHRTYQELAAHFHTTIIPARVKKPRDKAKVEGGVLIAERWILAALRDHTFFHLVEINQAIRPLQDELNAKPFQKLIGSRDQWFEEKEQTALQPLPATAYEASTWVQAKVNIDYHVIVDKHYYSVPHRLIHQPVEARLTATTVEIFHQLKRVATHVRSAQPGLFTTVDEHRPKSHQKYLQWTPGRLQQWGEKIGPECGRAIRDILARQPHPEQGFRSCLGIIRLGKAVGEARLEAACRRALRVGACSYRSIKSMLEHHLEAQPLEPELPLASPAHDNVRGAKYYT